MNRKRVILILAFMVLGLTVVYWFGVRQHRLASIGHHDAGLPVDGPASSNPAGADSSDASEVQEALKSANQRIVRLEGEVAALRRRLDELAQRPAAATSTSTSARAQSPEPDRPRRAWGAEQAAGPPDTFQAGDLQTAWAPRTPDGGEEWLKLDFERAVPIASIRVRETFNPGAVVRIAAAFGDGQELVLWQGDEPLATAPADVDYPAATSLIAGSVKVYLDTARVAGWNEIDAVELIGTDGSRQWARQASASSSYGDQSGLEALGKRFSMPGEVQNLGTSRTP